MQTIQTELSISNPKPQQPAPIARPKPAPANLLTQTGLRILTRITEMFESGYWYCRDCDTSTERVEREQGLPPMCGRCGSVRLVWKDPVVLADGAKLIQPGDLSAILPLPLMFARGGFGGGGGAFFVLIVLGVLFVALFAMDRGGSKSDK